MDLDLELLYRLLRAVAVRRGTIFYTALSEQYEEQTGDWIDPHLGWGAALAEIAGRCVPLCRGGRRPVLAALVINQHEGRPGPGFWGLRTEAGQAITPDEPDDMAWAMMVRDAHEFPWPQELGQLPAWGGGAEG